MGSALRQKGALYAMACVALAILAIATATAAQAPASADTAPVTLSAAPLGVNTAPWDYFYSVPGSAAVMQSLLKAAGVRQLRYGGGEYADAYDWQLNANIDNCLPDNATAPFTSSCASSDALNFSLFSRQARAIGAQSLVTVNYGSGTPALAKAWVKQASTPGRAVALWEIGNENYGCWEVNNELAGPPEHYKLYVPGIHTSNGDNPTCPPVTQGVAAGIQTLATSYAVNAKRFMIAMKVANPAAQIGVPWAFGSEVRGASVADNTEWNNTVLGADAKYISFVDVHYYPYGFSGSTGGPSSPTDQQVLQSLQQIPALDAEIRNELNAYDPTASVVVGETAVSGAPNMTTCTPVGALFAAGDVLSWLALGAKSVDWWDMDSYGNTGSRCVRPDNGFFTSSAKPVAETPYYGYALASVLAQPHAQLGTLDTSDPADVLAFQSVLPGGQQAVAFINTNISSAETVTFTAPLAGTLRTWRYSAANQNLANSKIVKGTTPATSFAAGITLPPESMTILQTT